MTGEKPPLAVTIIGGYLGAGKTTLVNAILAGEHGLRIAVLVNDFGNVAIDEALIAKRDGDVLALSNGCMCCQIGGDLYDAIDRILRMRDRFDHLLIETSGVADPGKVSQIAIAEPELEAACTIVLVDAVNFARVLDDDRLNDTLLRQVRAADSILLTKTESSGATAIADLHLLLAEAGAAAPIAILENGASDAWRFLANGKRADNVPEYGLSRTHFLPYASWSWTGTERIGLQKLVAFANNPDLNIYRLKGRVRLDDGRSIVIHRVAAEVTIEETTQSLGGSELVAIGVKPDFDPVRAETAWSALIAR